MNGAVLVTGASSGIGAATATRLAKRGIRVFAGVRRDADGAALVLAAGSNVTPLNLEVTDGASIERARASVEAALGGDALAGIVNNAGIVVAGPLEILPLEDLRRQFDVNFFAAIAVTQAFAPRLRASRGRIVNVSSISGKCSLPFVGAYCASKFALEAASDALRLELRPFGISVSLVEPGAVRTPLWQRSTDTSMAMMRALPAETIAPYEAAVQKVLEVSRETEARGVSADAVAAAIERALTEPRPRARYLVGMDARVQLLITRLPDWLRDRAFAKVLRLERA